MPVLFEGDCLIILIAIAAVSLPLQWPRLRLPRPFAVRRAAHFARVKASAVAANDERQAQERLDAALARVYANADYGMRMARIETAPADADLEEFYAQL